ncbi:MAG: IS1634 family transposase [Spirochaetia bacterium]|nr:IS1634 family transposase [Spirochaetia bacterium]
MYLSVIPQKRSNKHRMYIRESYRVHGVQKKRIVEDLGFVEDYLDVYDDPVAHFKEIARKKTSEKNYLDEEVEVKIRIHDFLDKQQIEKTDFSNRKNLGYIIISHFYHKLKLDKFINSRKRSTDITFNMDKVFQMLIYARIINPDSKLGTFSSRETFFEPMDFELQHVYRTLDYLFRWRSGLVRHLNNQMKKQFKRDTTLMYYDVTNYYFEIDDPKGMKQGGVSKEHRPGPIIQMGLFMDDMGVPVSYRLFDGNTNDCLTLQPNMETIRDDLQMEDIVVVADKGMMTGDNRGNILLDHNGYVISHTVRGADAEMKGWVKDQDDYICLDVPEKEQRYEKIRKGRTPGTGSTPRVKMKARFHPARINVKDKETGKTSKVSINERQIVYYSQKFADKAKKDREDAINKAMRFVDSGSTAVMNNYGSNKYIKTDIVAADGESLSKADCIRPYFNEQKLEEDEMLDGYYVICTNVIGLEPGDRPLNAKSRFLKDNYFQLNKTVSDLDIIEMYRGLWEIEETFKITKSYLNFRPVFHSKEERIEAHFLSCFVSLVITRLIEQAVESRWSTLQIIESLQKASGTEFENNMYVFDYYDDILEAFDKKLGTQFKRKYMTKGDLKNIIGKMKKG